MFNFDLNLYQCIITTINNDNKYQHIIIKNKI